MANRGQRVTELKSSRKWPAEGSEVTKYKTIIGKTSQHGKSHFTCTMQAGFGLAVKMVIHVEARPPLEQDGKDAADPSRDQNELLLGGGMT